MKPFSETTFGFFGLGQIGRAVLARLKGFGFRFAASDPGLSRADTVAMGVALMDPETLLREADILPLHAPATATMRGFLNGARLATMRPTRSS